MLNIIGILVFLEHYTCIFGHQNSIEDMIIISANNTDLFFQKKIT